MGRQTSSSGCRLILLACLVLLVRAKSQSSGKCPKTCYCHPYYHPTDGESVRVECKKGGMHEVPVKELEVYVHQLIISPQPNDPNYLTIGPILTQPEPFANLHDLTISNSNVPSIGIHSFWGLINLRTLNLTGNNITSITVEHFRGLFNLTALYLDYNRIEDMASETFQYLLSLKRLSLRHNNISVLVSRVFRMLAKLEILDLSFNPLGELNPEVFKDIQGLIVLKCRRCFLKRVNVQIYHLAPLIEELDLGQNLFKYLTDDDFTNLSKLKKLHFDGNQVSVIVDNVFHGNAQLRYLDISHNRISILANGAFTNLSNLNRLDLSYNRFSKFRLRTFTPVAKTLNSIDFSGNNLQLNEISVILQNLPKIQEIGLSNLSLKEVPVNYFMYNAHLTSLDLSSNLFLRFPYEVLLNTKYLRSLDLSNNKITFLKDKDLRRLEAIPKINLSPNPWQCDFCTLSPMFLYMNTTVLNETIQKMRCYTPMRHRGMRFSELTPDMLENCSSSIEGQMSIVAGLILVFMSVVTTAAISLYCTRRRGAQYYTNEQKRRERDQDHPEELLTANNGSVSTIHSSQHNTPKSS